MSGANEPRAAAGLRFNPYPAYKDSGVEWLGEIPLGWGLKCLKRIVQFRGGGTPTKDNAEYWRGDIPWVSPKDMKVSVVVDTEDKITAQAIRDSATKLVQAGAVLIVVRSGILVHSIPVALAGREVTLNQDLKALIPSSELLPEYLVYLISGMQLSSPPQSPARSMSGRKHAELPQQRQSPDPAGILVVGRRLIQTWPA